jgi:hypothetical protein
MRRLGVLTIFAATTLWGCPDIECISIGESYVAHYTMKDGTAFDEEILIGEGGSHSGQCGSGETATGWTQDCLNHDRCQHYTSDHGLPENPGGLGPNCLDEFNEAIEDYSRSLPKCDGS